MGSLLSCPFLVMTVTPAWPAQPLFTASASSWDEGAWVVLPSQGGCKAPKPARFSAWLRAGTGHGERCRKEGSGWAWAQGRGSGEVAVGQAEGVEGRVA